MPNDKNGMATFVTSNIYFNDLLTLLRPTVPSNTIRKSAEKLIFGLITTSATFFMFYF